MTDEETKDLQENELVLVACRVKRSREASMDGEGGLLDIDGELRMEPLFGTVNFYVEPHAVVMLPYQPEIDDNDVDSVEDVTERLSFAILESYAGEPAAAPAELQRGNLASKIGGEA